MPFPVVVSYAPQAASPRGYRGLCRALRVCPGGICYGRPAHACVVREQWLRAHIIYLFTHLYSSPLGRAHAAEVLGGSAATTVYWSEGERARSNFVSDPSIADYRFAHTISRTTCIALVCLREERRTPAVCSRFVWMERPGLAVVHSRAGDETTVALLGVQAEQQKADIHFLRHRFPGVCPHHLLHNLLRLHYGRHELCTAAPFSTAMCRHGTHAKPVLSLEEARHTAPAEGSLLFLPFGLSCRASDVGSLVAGCADCQHLNLRDCCGSCRRMNLGDRYEPASTLVAAGFNANLDPWQAAVGLGAPAPRADAYAMTGPWGDDEEEEWGGEDWYDEEEDWNGEDEWEEDSEEWATASWGDGAAEWGGAGDEWDAQDEHAEHRADVGSASGPGAWGAGAWVEDDWGNWAWVMDFAASAAASTGPAAVPPETDAAAAAASAATAAVRAVLAAGTGPAAPAPADDSAAAPDVSERIRVLELELELERLKRRRLA